MQSGDMDMESRKSGRGKRKAKGEGWRVRWRQLVGRLPPGELPGGTLGAPAAAAALLRGANREGARGMWLCVPVLSLLHLNTSTYRTFVEQRFAL